MEQRTASVSIRGTISTTPKIDEASVVYFIERLQSIKNTICGRYSTDSWIHLWRGIDLQTAGCCFMPNARK